MLKAVTAIACFAGIPLVRLVANNPGEPLPVGRFALYWAGLVAVLGGGVLLIGRGDKEKARRVGTAIALGTFAVVYLAVALSGSLRLGEILRLDGSIWLAVGLVAGGVLVSRWRYVQDLTLVLAAVLLIYPVAEAMTVGPTGSTADRGDAVSLALTPVITPNVYWLVFDGYGRADVLGDMGATSQEAFLEGLRTRGFRVDDKAAAAYPMSFLSLASTVSMEYIAGESHDVSRAIPYYQVVRGNNTTVRTFQSWGYEYALFPAPFWQGSQCSGYEDICLTHVPLSPPDWALLSMTAFHPIFELAFGGPEGHADRVSPVAVVDRVEALAGREPLFLFAHMINPHPPYYRLAPSCDVRDIPPDPIGDSGTEQEYLAALQCLNPQIIEAVDHLLARDPDAVIVLQSDHGPSNGIPLDSEPDTWNREQITRRLAVLNAIRLPDYCPVPEASSLANTFRLVFSCLSEEGVPLLETRSWVGSYGSGALLEVTSP